MHKLVNCKSFPNGTPIDAVQCRLVKAYERKEMPNGQYGPTTVQKAKVEDVAGNFMYLEAWGHPDLAKIEGQEVVLHADGKGKGLAIKHNSYVATKGEKAGKTITDVMLNLGKNGRIQTVAVYQQTAPAAEAATTQDDVRAAPEATTGYHPATAGLATNKALDVLIADGSAIKLAREGKLTAAVHAIGSQIAAGALLIEKGVKAPPAKQNAPKAVETPKALPAEVPPPRTPEEAGDDADEDVPF